MRSSTILSTLLLPFAPAFAAYKGFNYGSTFTDGSIKQTSDFQGEFTSARNLVGTSGFTSARLYTMIQGGTANSPTSAIQAAINTQTTLLLGLWASAGDAVFADEVSALTSAIQQYGAAFTGLIAGISVGSEDLYRITPTGIANQAGVGVGPSVLTGYIAEVRQAIAGTTAASAPVGHVDTWTGWVNASNDAVIAACDFLGMDAYPYFETTIANTIGAGNATFWTRFETTQSVSQGKPVWITETGWPVSGPTSGQAVASIANAQTYWDEVGCQAFGEGINTWWYTLQDDQPTTPAPSFGIVGAGNPPPTTPMYSLTC